MNLSAGLQLGHNAPWCHPYGFSKACLFGQATLVKMKDTTPHAKPHPEPLFEAARRMQLDPAHCWYVGDDARDIVAGRAAGMKTVAATYGYLGQQNDISRWNAHLHIDSPMDLLKFLKSA